MTEAMPFLQKTILLSYDPRSFYRVHFSFCSFILGLRTSLLCVTSSNFGFSHSNSVRFSFFTSIRFGRAPPYRFGLHI